MATIIGTTDNDKLIGTIGDDLIVANGGVDLLLGRGGADTYQLYFAKTPSSTAPYYTINETKGGDFSIDTITGTGSLVQWYTGGILDFARFSRGGITGQNLLIETAFKPHRYFSDGIESGTIKIVNQHNAALPTAQIEKFMAGGVEYNLLTTNIGTAFHDIMTGWQNADTLSGGDGNDYISGGGKADVLSGDAGIDIIFGNKGNDSLYGGADNDSLFGGNGRDRLIGESGDDELHAGDGKDVLRGDQGQDRLYGGTHDDRLFGGLGDDLLSGGAGNDRLSGGKGGDHYVFNTAEMGDELIIDKGNAAGARYGFITWNMDVVQLDGFASFDAGIHSIGVEISGDDLVITYANAGVTGRVTIQDHFLGDKFAMERLTFGSGSTAPTLNILHLSGDEYTYSVHGGSDVGGNDLVLGTTGDDQIYGGIGSDVMLGGGGADVFIFHDEEDNRGDADFILDFNLADDVLDFTEIKTLSRAGLTISDNSYGNAVITSAYGSIELNGISQADITDSIFAFL